MQYLWIMFLGLPPFMISQVYSSTLRECGETVQPMKAGVTAVFVNLVFNYLLIYGKFGFPELGVRGAAVATVLSRYVEVAIVIIWTHTHTEKMPFAKGPYPVLLGAGADVVAAQNIANTINNVFNVVFIALGDSVAIVVGQLLGAGDMKKARDTDNKMIAFSVMCCTGVALVMLVVAPFFPRLYNTNQDARELAKYFIMIMAIFMPQNAFLHAAYFTLRSGGKTIITFLFDSVFVWCVSVPVAYCLSRFTGLHVLAVFALVQVGDILKCIVGFVLVKKGVWMQNIVSGK